MNRIDQIEVLLKLLTSRYSTDPTLTGVVIIENTFKESVNECNTFLENDPHYSWVKNHPDVDGSSSEDYYWEYVKLCLKVLNCLRGHIVIEEEKLKAEASVSKGNSSLLNVKQQNVVKTVCEFIVHLGIGRNLLPGVGIPWEKRSKLSCFVPINDKCSHVQRQSQLYTTVATLIEISQYYVIGNVLFSNSLQDILSGLCQLAYWPLKKNDESIIRATDREMQMKIINSSRKMLQNVIDRAYQPKLIQELLFLQGVSKQKDIANQITPNYLRKAIGNLLLERLLKKQGVKSFIIAILDSADGDEKVEQREWVKCDVIVKLISSFAKQESHFISFSSQILELLDDDCDHLEKRHQFSKIGKLIIENMAPISPQLADRLLFQPLFKDLIACSAHSDLLPTEKELNLCIVKLNKIFTVNAGPSQTFVKYLTPVIEIIFCIYSFLNESLSDLRNLTEILLVSYFKTTSQSDYLSAYQMFLFAFEETESTILRWNTKIELNHSSEGGICLTERLDHDSEECEWTKTDFQNASAFCKLMVIINDDKIVSTIFLSLLENLSFTFDIESFEEQVVDDASHLMQIEIKSRRKEIHLRKLLITLNALSELCQTFSMEKAIMKDKLKTITLIENILAKGAKLCESNKVFECTSGETLHIAMSILTLIIEQDFSMVKDKTKSILTSLKILSNKHMDENVRMLADELHNYIATLGAVPITRQQPLVENIRQSHSEKPESRSEEKTTPSSVFELMWQDLNDCDIPTKGHALVVCTKLIQTKNKETIENKEKLLSVLLESLSHDDTYVYGLATRALAALAVEFPDFILPCLIKNYGDELNCQLQMKIGEVILKLVTELNDVVVKYRDLLLNCFLNATKSKDPLIRASSLSNLGQLCQGLKFSLGPNVHEIFLHLSNFTKCDTCSQVRSAAVQVLTLLLRGLGKDAIRVLDTVLKEIYRLLKHTYVVDKDEIVKQHVLIALQELDVLCREFLFPKQILEKKIQILGDF